MSWVFDATPLIYLAKPGRLDVIETLDEPRIVPAAVHREVVIAGIERGYDDARRIERAVEAGLLDVGTVDPTDSPVATRLRRHPGLSDADVAVLACAGARDGVAMIEVSAGRSAAEVENIETRGTAYLVLSAVKRGAMAPELGHETTDAMIDAGWYVSSGLYTKLVRTLESFE